MTANERETLARTRLNDIRGHVAVLASDADTQNSWLHPCGWSRAEPYVHATEHAPCAPIVELADSFFDMWPAWRPTVAPVLRRDAELALDRLASELNRLDDPSLLDEAETLDGEQWVAIRRIAEQTLAIITK